MGCNCGGTKKTEDTTVYVVTSSSGSTKEVMGEHTAKVEATMTGGTYRRK